MNNWVYGDKNITQLSINTDYSQYYGFIYKITNLIDNRFYYGKKTLWKTVRRAAPKKKDGSKSLRKRLVKQPSDWHTYWSSCEELKADVVRLGEDKFKREILEFCHTKGEQSFKETELLFVRRVLKDPLCYNSNISGKWFKE